MGIIDGRRMAAEITEEVKQQVAVSPIVPSLAIVQVGDNPASTTYVRLKRKAAEKCGIRTKMVKRTAESSADELLETVLQLNADESVHGILVQLPLPESWGTVAERAIVQAVAPEKDVDGLHAVNLGQLALEGGDPPFSACTPLGCLEMLKRLEVEIRGKHAVVIGASNVVGRPLMLMLLNEGATVTVCHIDSVETHTHSREADILISATGVAHLVRRHWVKEGAVVIDVGVAFTDGGRMVGDVMFDEVADVVSLITPVPGGVGPMTIAMLMRNTARAAAEQVRREGQARL